MNLPVWIAPRADLDIAELALYIGRDSNDAANRFLDAIDDLFSSLAQSPELGQRCSTGKPRQLGMRVSRVNRFPNHLVYYISRPDEIQIVRVLHGARDLDAAFD